MQARDEALREQAATEDSLRRTLDIKDVSAVDLDHAHPYMQDVTLTQASLSDNCVFVLTARVE